ncbi:MAG TPA: DUF3667 domain-containing protein [Candidatus Angelobacter sp.]|jgi:hypothetical protein|nr:DUF3667 domain-containing protein [Candidatus Angelobacter sp.]
METLTPETAASLPHQETSQNCPECAAPLVDKYCHRCGEKLPDVHDLTLKHFIHHGLHELTHFDSKIFRTVQALLFRPGLLTVEYLAGRRKRYVLPLRLFLVIFALNFFLYTRPGVALYDMRFITSTPQSKQFADLLERKAAKRHMDKEVLFDQINEHWQHNASLFQLGEVFFFAVWLAVLNWRRYFVEHLIFALHVSSFTLLFGSVTWLYYLRYGFKQNVFLIGISFTVLLLYLWRAVPKMYGTTGGKALLKSFVLLIGLEVSRVFFVSFTMMLSLFQTLRR